MNVSPTPSPGLGCIRVGGLASQIVHLKLQAPKNRAMVWVSVCLSPFNIHDPIASKGLSCSEQWHFMATALVCICEIVIHWIEVWCRTVSLRDLWSDCCKRWIFDLDGSSGRVLSAMYVGWSSSIGLKSGVCPFSFITQYLISPESQSLYHAGSSCPPKPITQFFWKVDLWGCR